MTADADDRVTEKEKEMETVLRKAEDVKRIDEDWGCLTWLAGEKFGNAEADIV